MSLSLQASLAKTMLGLSPPEKAAASALIMLGTSYASKTAANTIDLMGLVKFLQGRESPPAWLRKAAPFIRKFGSLPGMSQHVGVLMSSVLKEKEVDEGAFLSLVSKVSTSVEVPLRSDSVAHAAEDLLTLVTKRLEDAIDPDTPTVVVECVYCGEFFGAHI